MNHGGKSPMLGDNPIVAKGPDSYEPFELNSVPKGDGIIGLQLINIVSPEDGADDLCLYQPAPDFPGIAAPLEPPLQANGRERSQSLEDVQDIINMEMNMNVGAKNYEFQVLDSDRTRSVTHAMKDNTLFAMPLKDVPISVKGAEPDFTVKAWLRYTTGAHYNTPVRACRSHDDMSDPGYSFYIPKAQTFQREEHGHLVILIPLILNLQDDGTFSFPLVFRCLNSCHKDNGKAQELILQLCNADNTVVHERCIRLRICRNVNRDIKLEGADAGRARTSKVHAGRKVKVEKQEEEEEEEVLAQANTSAQRHQFLPPSPPLSFLPPSQNIRVQVELHPHILPLLTSFTQVFGGRVYLPDGENGGTQSSDPPSNTWV